MHSIFATYLAFLEDDAQRKPATLANVRRALVRLDDWLGDQDATKVTNAELKNFVRDLLKEYKVSTVRKMLTSVQAAYRYAREGGHIGHNPCFGLSRMLPTEIAADPLTYSPDELRAILGACRSERDELIVYVLAFSGLRAHEALALRWYRDQSDPECSWVNFENDQLHIFGKGAKKRLVPLHPVLRERLFRARNSASAHPTWVFISGWNQHLSSTQWTKLVTAIMKRAGIEGKRSHVFRKTLSTDLNRRGVRPDVIDRIFGWAATDIRSRYYTGRVDQDMRAAIVVAYADEAIFPEQSHLKSVEPRPATQPPDLTEALELRIRLLELENEPAPQGCNPRCPDSQ